MQENRRLNAETGACYQTGLERVDRAAQQFLRRRVGGTGDERRFHTRRLSRRVVGDQALKWIYQNENEFNEKYPKFQGKKLPKYNIRHMN